MKIYIALDHNGEPLGLLLATEQAKANIAYHAMGITPHSIEEIDPAVAVGIDGVAFILTSTKVDSRELAHRSGGFFFRKWRRGL